MLVARHDDDDDDIYIERERERERSPWRNDKSAGLQSRRKRVRTSAVLKRSLSN